MTISTTDNRKQYLGNGVTTVFSFPYRFFDDTDVVVSLVNNATGVATVQTLTTDYTLTGAGGPSGGNVTMVTAPTSTETLVIYRSVPMTQETDYITGDPFPAETHETALDRATVLIQQLQDQVNRAVRVSSDVATAVAALDALEAGQYLKVNDTASGFEYTNGTTLNAAAQTETQVLASGQTAVVFTASPAVAAFFINGSDTDDGRLRSGTDYTVSGNTVTLAESYPAGTELMMVYYEADADIANLYANEIQYTQGGTGSVYRSVENRLRDTVSVKDFGAVGDGVTDDTVAIQAAIDASSTIEIPADSYVNNTVIDFGKAVVKGGEGSTLLGVGATFSGASGADIYNFSVSDLTLDGLGTSGQTGLRSDYAHRCLYNNVVVQRYDGSGAQAAVFDNAFINTFSNFYSALNRSGPIFQNDSNANCFTGSSFNNCTDAAGGVGATVVGSYANVFMGCDFEYNWRGLVLDNTVGTGAVNQMNTAAFCYFEGNSQMAIGVGFDTGDVDAEHARIISPTINSMPGGVTQGIYLDKSHSGLVWYPYFGGGTFNFAKINLGANSKNTTIEPFRPSEIVKQAGATVSDFTIQSNLATVVLDGSGAGFTDVFFHVPYSTTDDLALPPVFLQLYEETDVVTAPVGSWRVNSVTANGFRIRVIGGTPSATYKFFWRAGI